MLRARSPLLIALFSGGLAVLTTSGCGSSSNSKGSGGSGGGSAGTTGNGGSAAAGTSGAAGQGGHAGAATAGTDGGTGEDGQAGTGAAATVATLFVPDNIDNVVYRYNITPGSDPVLTAMIPDTLAYAVAVRSTGELFVGNYLQAGTISRFLSPLGVAAPNGVIANDGIVYPDTMLFVDDELWIPGTADNYCGSEAANLVRLAFDTQGNASVAGTVTSGLTGADRGMAWGSAGRDLFVSQCGPSYAIQHYHVATDHTVTPLAALSGNGIYNPGGMIFAPWGELLVSNEGTMSAAVHGNSILRFLVDAQGNVTPNGTISGNGMDSPFGLAFTPWGELVVCNNSAATLSRFTFDASHVASPHGTFQLVAAQNNGIGRGTASIVIVPGASTALVPGDAGTATDGSSADASGQ